MIIILPISINLILCILLFIVYCVHVLYVRFDMCKINDSQSVSLTKSTIFDLTLADRAGGEIHSDGRTDGSYDARR